MGDDEFHASMEKYFGAVVNEIVHDLKSIDPEGSQGSLVELSPDGYGYVGDREIEWVRRQCDKRLGARPEVSVRVRSKGYEPGKVMFFWGPPRRSPKKSC